jgi:hypothetical protein
VVTRSIRRWGRARTKIATTHDYLLQLDNTPHMNTSSTCDVAYVGVSKSALWSSIEIRARTLVIGRLANSRAV